MRLNLKNLSNLGFTGGLMSRSISIDVLWRKDEALNRVWFTSGYSPNMVGYFQLTQREMARFKAGKIGLTPPGFCSPGTSCPMIGGERATILFEGIVKSKKHLLGILNQGLTQ